MFLPVKLCMARIDALLSLNKPPIDVWLAHNKIVSDAKISIAHLPTPTAKLAILRIG